MFLNPDAAYLDKPVWIIYVTGYRQVAQMGSYVIQVSQSTLESTHSVQWEQLIHRIMLGPQPYTNSFTLEEMGAAGH